MASDSAQPVRKRKRREITASEPSEEGQEDAREPVTPESSSAGPLSGTGQPDREEVLEQEMQPTPLRQESASQPQPVQQESISRPVLSRTEAPSALPSENEPESPTAMYSKPVRYAEAHSEPEPPAEAPQTPPRNLSSAGKLLLYLNGKMLILPPKADGQPYYLMDMLEYSDLELEKVTSPVVLEVNGQSGTFGQELKSGDTLKIYEQSEKR